MKKDAYYFPHDANARRDPKIVRMRHEYGAEGYAWYFMLLEIMREQTDYKIHIHTQIDLKNLADELRVKPETLREFLSSCVKKYRLFDRDRTSIWSGSFMVRMSNVNERRITNSKNAKSRWEKQKTDAIALQSHCDQEAVKESKGNESKGEYTSHPSPPENPNQDVEILLFQCWGMEGRKLGTVTLLEFVKLKKEHSWERLEYAVREAARHNKKSLAYVQGILKGAPKKEFRAKSVTEEYLETQRPTTGG